MIERIDVRRPILAENEEVAEKLRSQFQVMGTLVLNLISSPGSGKTTLLESTVQSLPDLKMGVLEGDIATERDAERIRRLGIPAHQILTGGACHLDARQIAKAIDTAGFSELDILFIENVGNLICPTAYDLGEDVKVAVLSVTEGEDKPFKYPAIFSRADATIISKMDLLRYVDFNLIAVQNQIRYLNRNSRLFVTSSKSGEGISDWTDYLEELLAQKKAARYKNR